MKNVICSTLICCCAATVFATPYYFTDTLGQNAWIDVAYWTGTGDCKTILVVDWNQSGDYTVESYAFGYRWDGTQTTVAQMLHAITSNGGLSISTGYGGAFIYNLSYTDAYGELHIHNEEGSFNLGSTGDVFADWGNMNDDWTMLGDWYANQAGIDSEYIADSQLEGINVMYWFDSSQPYENLDVPFVPEPATLAMLALGSLLLRKKR
jgi:hypothetical protein